MIRPQRPALPSVFPPEQTDTQRIAILRARLGWTPCQAKVVLMGAEIATYHEIGVMLGMKSRTVRAHICLLASRHDHANQSMLTALAIAVLWQTVRTQAGVDLDVECV